MDHAAVSSRVPFRIVVGLVAASAALWAAHPGLPADVGAALEWMADSLAVLTWPSTICLVAVVVLHYAAAAAAARAAAGVPLPFGELIVTQFAAAAANRLTPNGLGGAAVNGRYFHRRGELAPACATAAVFALAMVGGIANVLAFATVIGVGALFGVGGVSGEVSVLVGKITALVPVPTGIGRWVLVGAAVAAAVVASISCLRASTLLRRCVRTARTAFATFTALLGRPARLTALMSASAATTLLLATGFAAVATLTSDGLPAVTFLPLMVGYMVAAAAGNVLPTPGGIGTADAALVGVLVAGGMPLAHAMPAVLAFRLVTFWAPAAVGVCVARPLRRRQAL